MSQKEPFPPLRSPERACLLLAKLCRESEEPAPTTHSTQSDTSCKGLAQGKVSSGSALFDGYEVNHFICRFPSQSLAVFVLGSVSVIRGQKMPPGVHKYHFKALSLARANYDFRGLHFRSVRIPAATGHQRPVNPAHQKEPEFLNRSADATRRPNTTGSAANGAVQMPTATHRRCYCGCTQSYGMAAVAEGDGAGGGEGKKNSCWE